METESRVEYPLTQYTGEPYSNLDVLKYLAHITDKPPHLDELPSHLDFSDFTPFFDELYTSYKSVPVLEDIQSEFEDIDNPKMNPVLRYMYQKQKELYSVEAPGERGTVIYWDSESNEMTRSPISYGNFTSTVCDYSEVLQKNGVPLIDVHTHPSNNFFSIKDFGTLLHAAINGNALTNATAVLCPDHQIIAIATAETPLCSDETINYLVETETMSESEKRRHQQLLNRFIGLNSIILNKHNRMTQDLLDFFDTMMLDGIEDNAALKEHSQPWSDEYFAYQTEYFTPKLQRVSEKLYKRKSDYLSWVLNKNQIAFAREMSLKLYISQNMKDFVAFCA